MGENLNTDLEPREAAVVERAAAFARDVVVPRAAAWERFAGAPAEVIKAAAEAGLCGLLAPRGLGGAGLGVPAMARVMEELAWADFAVAFSLLVHNNLVGAICREGTTLQVEHYVPELVSGASVGAFLLTEPGAGTDAAAIATQAKGATTGETGWVLNGTKTWITNASVANVLNVYAQTDPSRGSAGIASFIVESSDPGVAREDPYWLLGAHAMGTGGFRFTDCPLQSNRQLSAPGRAFKAALAGIDIARVMVSAMCAGMLQRSLDLAVEHTTTRRAFGQAVSEFQGVQWQLAEVATDLFATRAMAYTAARSLDRGDPGATLQAAHAKKFATRAALQGVSQSMQALGARGLRQDLPLARHLAAAKTAQYLDGTTEVQNVVISRALFAGRAAQQGSDKPSAFVLR